ncbi:hypothetical protein MTR_0092s0080 [Medicago truncatula]|uniref:Uncharacterized protein n=1 Tax=Medicago truncatula TaxID=3880 RepID=A0A072THT6_MEDTR|nr:hypothetical protein MTR_0092s0080 [Medicago truncatula]
MTKSSIKTDSFATFLAGDDAGEDDEGLGRKKNGTKRAFRLIGGRFWPIRANSGMNLGIHSHILFF